MSCWITTTSFITKVEVQMVQDQFNRLLLTTRDEMFEDIGEIEELEPVVPKKFPFHFLRHAHRGPQLLKVDQELTR